MGRKHTYYAAYHYSYEYFDTQEKDWIKSTDFDAKIISDTLKRDIPKKIKDEVLYELRNDDIRNFEFKMDELYLTTDDACL